MIVLLFLIVFITYVIGVWLTFLGYVYFQGKPMIRTSRHLDMEICCVFWPLFLVVLAFYLPYTLFLRGTTKLTNLIDSLGAQRRKNKATS